MGSFVLRGINGGPVVVDGALNNVIPDGSVGDAASYWFVEAANTHPTLSLTSLRLYLSTLDAGGGTLAVAVADGTARALTYGYVPPAGSGLTYTTATTAGAGLALPDLAAGTKCLIAVKRDLTAASTAWPEVNAVGISCTASSSYV